MKGGVLVEELKAIREELVVYICTILTKVRPLVVAIFTGLNYLFFPDDTFKVAAYGIGFAVLVDAVTKYYALSVNNGGFKNALSIGAINSESFFIGTRKKIIGVLILMILTGLSVRVTMLESAAIFLSTIAYSVMFIRECQSIAENMIEAGHDDFEWFLIWSMRKEHNMFKDDGLEDEDLEKIVKRKGETGNEDSKEDEPK